MEGPSVHPRTLPSVLWSPCGLSWYRGTEREEGREEKREEKKEEKRKKKREEKREEKKEEGRGRGQRVLVNMKDASK